MAWALSWLWRVEHARRGANGAGARRIRGD
jgi:hypothetical protein